MSDSWRATSPTTIDVTHGRQIPAWMLSVLLHVLVLVALGLWIPRTPQGAVPEPARTAGIVLAQSHQGKVQYWSPERAEEMTSESASASAASRSSFLPESSDMPQDVAATLPGPGQLLEGSGELAAALPGADSLTEGAQRGRGLGISGSQVQTGVFGVQGTGSKFVYVFDRSASMAGFGGRPLAAAKSELLKSLRSLESVHQFQIIFYNEKPKVFSPVPGQTPHMMFGDEPNKELAEKFVNGILADGGTEHMQALVLALGLKPDVIFFLTDAAEPQLSAGELLEIQRRNRRSGTSINTVEFGSGPSPRDVNFLMRLAQQNGGRYVYVDVTRLPRSGL